MEPTQTEHEQIRDLLLENQKLLKKNNELLNKLHRHSVWAFVSRIVGFLIIIGAPVALYYYVIEPYFNSVGESLQSFTVGLQEVPGWEQLKSAVQGKGTE